MTATEASSCRAEKHTRGAMLAASVAALFAAGCEKAPAGTEGTMPAATSGKTAPMVQAPADGNTVQCLGIHECKGKSACHVQGGHACAGQNSCKGKGWIHVSRAECDAKGGKVLDG